MKQQFGYVRRWPTYSFVDFHRTSTSHLVLGKHTSAGFTVNTAKCQFCKPEIKFLGHIILDEGVKADCERIEAILRYLVPMNPRQLRKFLGILTSINILS